MAFLHFVGTGISNQCTRGMFWITVDGLDYTDWMKPCPTQIPATAESSLGNFFAELLRTSRFEEQCQRAGDDIQQRAEAAGTTVLDLLNQLVVNERSRINSVNRSKGGGRRPSEGRQQLCGLDPLEAARILELCTRLGVLSGAKLRSFMAKEAIATEDAAAGRQSKSSEMAKRLTEREKRLKTLFEDPPQPIAGPLAEWIANLPLDRAGLQDELAAVAARVWGIGH